MTMPADRAATTAAEAACYPLDFATLAVPEAALAPVRHDIYHSTGPGYHVFRGFLTPALARHMQRFWVDLEIERVHQRWPGMRHIAKGCPNYGYGEQAGNRGYFNFFWNHPPDEATYAVSMQLQWLRNRVMGRAPFEEILPLYGRAANYRIVISARGEEIIKPHADWTGAEYVREPARLQATLYLSTPGIDYEGDGFVFRTNQGNQVVFGRDVPISAGDLVMWRYCNEHSVRNVASGPGQAGFVRILYASDEVHEARPKESFNWHLAKVQAMEWLAGTEFGGRVLRPIYRRLRGR